MLNTELVEIRESLGLTKAELANLLGTTSMLIGRMEKGSCKIAEKFEEALKALIAKNTEKEEAPVVEEAVVEEAAVEETVVEEPAAEEEAPAEEKPKRRNPRRKKKESMPAEETPAPAVEEAPSAEAAPAPAPEKRAAKKNVAPAVVIQSAMGGSISVEEIVARIPAGADEVYVKVEENKAYWVKGGESGAVDLW